MKKNPNRVKTRIKAKISSADWRLIVSRSLRHLSAQLVETNGGRVKLGAVDSKIASPKDKLTKTDRANRFGKWFGDQISTMKVTHLAFDRNGRRYHGRIKAFADGVRSAGVKF